MTLGNEDSETVGVWDSSTFSESTLADRPAHEPRYLLANNFAGWAPLQRVCAAPQLTGQKCRDGSTTVLEARLCDFRFTPDRDRICYMSDVAEVPKADMCYLDVG